MGAIVTALFWRHGICVIYNNVGFLVGAVYWLRDLFLMLPGPVFLPSEVVRGYTCTGMSVWGTVAVPHSEVAPW